MLTNSAMKNLAKSGKIDMTLSYFTSFLINRDTYDVGSLQIIQENMKNNSDLFIEGIHNLISKVSENFIRKRNRETINLDSLVLIVIEALLTNQLAGEITKKTSLAPYKVFIQKFLSPEFFHDCKEMIRCKPSEHKTNFSYLSCLFDQINLIFKKMKLDKEFDALQNMIKYKELRDFVKNSSLKMIPEEEIQNEILSKLFTRDLNDLLPLLSWQNNNVEVQFSVIRVYLKFYQNSPQWIVTQNPKAFKLDGKTMIFNLLRCYVETFEGNKDFLFKEENSDNPLFCFIVNYMQMAFLPIYYDFSQLFEQNLMNLNGNKPIEQSAEDFFQNKALGNEILSFFENLPVQLKNFLSLLHELIKQSKNPNDRAPSNTALRGLLINRFLFNPMLKMMADPDIATNNSYLKTANFFKDLFYSKSLVEKYSNIPQFPQLCLSYVNVFNQITTDFQGNVPYSTFMASKAMLMYDYELIYRALKDVNRLNMTPQKNYDFIEYQEPSLIKNVRTLKAPEDFKPSKTPTNMPSALLKAPQVKITTTNEQQSAALRNNFDAITEKTPSNAPLNSPHIPLFENHMRKEHEFEDIENEVKKRLDLALSVEREAQKMALEKMMEERFQEWEQEHNNKEIQENIKNKDALLNEMYEKINIEEQKFQMLMKIRELDDENSNLKVFLETCPPYYNYTSNNGNEEDFDDQLSNEEEDPEEKIMKIKEKELNDEEEKRRREQEFYDLCSQSQQILLSMANEENDYERELKINPELW